MIDTSIKSIIKDLGRLSFAFGVPGSGFALKYLYDHYASITSLPAVHYMRPIGVFLICVSLLLAPAAYKILLPGIKSLIYVGEGIISRTPAAHGIKKTIFYVSILKLIKLVFLCAHPLFAIILAVTLAH
jgi:hypothetical protein